MCEMPSCYGVVQRTARVVHQCCECRGKIMVGEVYNYHHGVWDGVGAEYKVCLDCDALRVECDRDVKHDDERTPFEGLHDAVDGLWRDRKDLFVRFVHIKSRRDAFVPEWMVERVEAVGEVGGEVGGEVEERQRGPLPQLDQNGGEG